MYQYRQALLSMRRGDTDRQIAQTKVLGRPKLAQLREHAVSHGWLDPGAPLPDDAVLAEVFGKIKRAASTRSSLEAHRQQIAEWMQAGVGKREENQGRNVQWHIAMRPGKRRTLGRGNMGRMLESYERAKASLRSRVKHPFRVIKRQFGFTKVRPTWARSAQNGLLGVRITPIPAYF